MESFYNSFVGNNFSHKEFLYENCHLERGNEPLMRENKKLFGGILQEDFF